MSRRYLTLICILIFNILLQACKKSKSDDFFTIEYTKDDQLFTEIRKDTTNPLIRDTTLTKEQMFDTLFKKMNYYISLHTIFPEEARIHNIIDSVPVLFGYDKNKKIYGYKISPVIRGGRGKKYKPIGYGCEEEALRVVNSMKDWYTINFIDDPEKWSGVINVYFPPKIIIYETASPCILPAARDRCRQGVRACRHGISVHQKTFPLHCHNTRSPVGIPRRFY